MSRYDMETIDKRLTPRMPWHDIHVGMVSGSLHINGGNWVINHVYLLGWSTSQGYSTAFYPAMELYKVNNSSSRSYGSTLPDAKGRICVIPG